MKTLTQKTLTAFWLSFLGGLWMFLSCRFLYGNFSRMPAGLGRHHMMWGRGMMTHFGWGWPWFGLIAGLIVMACAIAFYFSPQHQRSLGLTIVIVSLLNLFLGMGGVLASALGIVGGVVALLPRQTNHLGTDSLETDHQSGDNQDVEGAD
ncbi:hypothetical protein [Leptothoe sp. PORK10 BA2]|uniref:hypothetical protein n=1 Tax=Leptothoe sp. PORK10 BA2 TaxID=3110254 RepID=UPI002B21E834|nr:hypothetical protein [Leptothoe sp. PORK10 BA2]MEA5463806.1 hypothetical protein [Leptothoe sp. PORK10 BA2]